MARGSWSVVRGPWSVVRGSWSVVRGPWAVGSWQLAVVREGGAEMTEATGVCPLSREQIVAQYFLEHRARLLDIAAFLDRLDRAAGGGLPDFREQALLQALRLVADGGPQRTARVLNLFSDMSE
ncbi:hypothetical protein E3A20_18440 [Planctomyces bekefii]|uniref:Uncharacterized protein n=1 Tax=Planctomyces bekefii TaxID=1653850 RepID=A0A5C6M4I1_9PLAN|nr:hypothetical protein E3A20_18440 [Planctomyces bekefii]